MSVLLSHFHLLSTQPTLANPHPLHQPEGTTGKACVLVRGSKQSTPAPFSENFVSMTASTPAFPTPLSTYQCDSVGGGRCNNPPRTTAWGQRKEAVVLCLRLQLGESILARCVGTTCMLQDIASIMANGTSQKHQGKYIPKDEWLAQRRAEKRERSN